MNRRRLFTLASAMEVSEIWLCVVVLLFVIVRCTGFFKRHFLNNPPLQLLKATPAELRATGQVRLDAREKNKKCRCVTARSIICG